jgi:hypothetical protein
MILKLLFRVEEPLKTIVPTAGGFLFERPRNDADAFQSTTMAQMVEGKSSIAPSKRVGQFVTLLFQNVL